MQLYIARPDQNHGPYTLVEAKAYLASGQLNLQDMAWFEGCADWMPLRQIQGIQAPLGGTPPPPPNFALPPSDTTTPLPVVSQPAQSTDFAERTIFEMAPSVTSDLILTALTCGLWFVVLVPKMLSCRYRLTTQRLIRTTGLVSRRVEEAELYRVKDVTVEQGAMGRMLGFGTVVVHLSDASTPRLHLTNVNNPVRVKEQIREQSRISRRVEGVRTVEYGSAH